MSSALRWGGVPLALALSLAPSRPESSAPAPSTAPSYEQTMRLVVAKARAGEWDTGLAAVSELLAAGAELSEHRQSEAQFALGLLRFEKLSAERAGGAGEPTPDADGWLEAASAFASARALAGPGDLRLRATYDGALVHLALAEDWRSRIPEVAGAAAAAGPPGATPLPPVPAAPHGGTAPSGEEPPDPLVEARTAYETAREHFVERLRADWHDADTRANLELIQRRLRELEEIERQREEQQQEQQQQQGEDGEQGDEGDPGDEGEPGENEQQPDDETTTENPDPSQQGDEPQGDGEAEQQPAEPPDPSEVGEPQETGEPQEAPRPEEGTGEAQSAEEAPAERHLTREEAMRLLDRLSEIEEEGEALQAILREAQRVPVERDW